MQSFSTLEDAIELAKFAHRKQTDKTGMPYIDHPLRVLQIVQDMGGAIHVQIAAVLHDLTEDTNFTPQILLDLGFPKPAVNLIKLLDRDHSAKFYTSTAEFGMDMAAPGFKQRADDYYYARIIADPNARMIKIADIKDNTLPWRLSYLDQKTQDRLIKKYAKAMEALNEY